MIVGELLPAILLNLCRSCSRAAALRAAIAALLVVCAADIAEAQKGNLRWAKLAGGSFDDQGNAITLDGQGNSYVTGYFQGTATFGSGEGNQTQLMSAGGFDVFIAKYNSNGTLAWAKKAGGASTDQGNGIALDNSGNIYVVGAFVGAATFGAGEVNETELTAAGTGADIFVAKYNPDGTLAWVKQAGSASGDSGDAIALDSQGNSYITGLFFGTATFGAGEANQTQLTALASFDFFVAKYSSNGALVWAKSAQGSSFTERGRSIAVDSQGNSYVTGAFSATITFGPGELNQTQLTSAAASSDIFVAKYNSDGTLAWAKGPGGTGGDSGFGIALDSQGNGYVAGLFAGTATFGQGEINQTQLTSAAASDDIFIAKYNNDGTLAWAKRAGGNSSDFAIAIALDSQRNSYVTGQFSGSATFGQGEANQTTLTSTTVNADVFVAKYDSGGMLVWAKKVSGPNTTQGRGVAVDPLGNSYVTGLFNGETTFGAGEPNEINLTSGGFADIFVAKFAGCTTAMDFDGDCKSDIAVYRNGLWIVQKSSGGVTATPFGGGSDVPVPADYDGDGKTDIAVYRDGLWIILKSSDGLVTATQFGGGTDVPMPGDYDGDGKTDIAVYRSGLWIYAPSSGGANVAVQFGGGTDVPMPGDYDGDGKTDIAVYRSGLWIYQPSSGGANVGVFFGGGTDIPVPADYDGDGKTDFAVYRGGLWIYAPSSGGAHVAVFFGGGTDVPVPADYDGDGKTDVAIYRNGLWVYKPSAGGADIAVFFGGGSDVPLN